MRLCAGLTLDEEGRRALDRELASPAVAWNSLVAAAVREGIAPLLDLHLGRDDRVPSGIRAALRSARLAAVARELAVRPILGSLLRDAGDEGLSVVVVKGAFLAEYLYGGPGLRPYLDVDLLVRPGQWPELRSVLKRTGWDEPAAPDHGGARPPVPGGAAWLESPVFRKGGLSVEVHLNPLGLHMPLRDEGAFWNSLRRVLLAGAPALALDWPRALCTAAVHAQQHSYGRLVWLVDLAEMAKLPGLDKAAIVAAAEAEGIAGPLRHGLRMAARLRGNGAGRSWAFPFPAASLEDRALSFLWPAERVLSRRALTPAPYYTPSILAFLRRREPVAAWHGLRRILFPPRNWVDRNYPGRRGFRLLAHYIRRVAGPWIYLAKRGFR